MPGLGDLEVPCRNRNPKPLACGILFPVVDLSCGKSSARLCLLLVSGWLVFRLDLVPH